jgi:hypothetical protein
VIVLQCGGALGAGNVGRLSAHRCRLGSCADLVIANGRVGKIDKVLTSVSKLMAAERNEIKVVVTTAGKVAAKQMEEMKALLLYRVKKQYGSTAQMLLSTAVRPYPSFVVALDPRPACEARPI